jgi:hypothetical protein
MAAWGFLRSWLGITMTENTHQDSLLQTRWLTGLRVAAYDANSTRCLVNGKPP